MKKILYSIFAIALALPAMASAATFSFAPTSATFAPGKTFSSAVFVTPSTNEKITTAKLSLKYPTDLLEVVSFTPTIGWIALPLPGSNLVDNKNGKLIKTAGFPAKITSTKQFGTILFKAKKAGSAKISTNSDSMLINPANVNKYSGSTGASFTIVKPAPPKPKVKPPVKHKAVLKPIFIKKTTDTAVTGKDLIANVVESATTTELATTTEPATTAGTATTTASASTTESVNTSNGLFSTKNIAFAVVFLLLVIGWLFFLKKKKSV